MRLRFGKEDWLELEPVSLDSHDELGVRTFSLAPQPMSSPIARSAASRAAVVANRVVAQTFQKSVAAYASPAERAKAGTDKVETAVFYDPRGNLRVVYREVVIRFEPNIPETKQKAVLNEYGLEIREHNPFHTDQLIAFDPGRKYIAERMVELANKLTEMDEVVFAFPNFVSEFKRSLQAPAPVTAQWHLPVVEAKKAWSATQGDGIVIAVLDDGVDVDHPNLKPNIKRKPDPSEPRDLFGRDFFVGEDAPHHFDPKPKRFRAPFEQMRGNDIHGTCCAGVAAASGRNGVFGIAPNFRSRSSTRTISPPNRVSQTRFGMHRDSPTFFRAHGAARHHPIFSSLWKRPAPAEAGKVVQSCARPATTPRTRLVFLRNRASRSLLVRRPTSRYSLTTPIAVLKCLSLRRRAAAPRESSRPT